MASILLPSRYTQQPQQATQIEWGNPIARGLALAANPGAGAFDLANNRNATASNGMTRGAGALGVGFKAAANSSLGMRFADSRMASSDGAGTGDFTYLVIANPKPSTTREMLIASQNGAQEFYLCANIAVAGSTATSGRLSAFTNVGGSSGAETNGYIDGAPHVYGYSRAGAIGSLYADGRLVAGATVLQAQMWSATSSDYVGGYNSAGFGTSNSVFLVLGWNRALSNAEIAVISANPWQLFKAPARRLWLASAATGAPVGATLAATLATLTRTASAGVAVRASSSRQLGAAQATANGSAATAAQTSRALGGLSLSASGAISTTRRAALARTLATATASARGTTRIAAQLAASFSPASAGGAARAAFSRQLGAVSLAASGSAPARITYAGVLGAAGISAIAALVPIIFQPPPLVRAMGLRYVMQRPLRKDRIMLLGKFAKQPVEREAYAIEYADDLASGDTLADLAPTIAFARSGPGLDASPLRLEASEVGATRLTMWLGAGTDGSNYKVSVTVATSSGRILQDEFTIKIKDF
jgi:hypothetical protein